MTRRIMIIAGEASGEARAARLVDEMRQRHPGELEFIGIGGNEMKKAGVELHYHVRDMAVLGLFEVLKHYRFIKGALEEMKTLLQTQRPNMLILVDYSGFNLRLAPTAKALGIPVCYYISPQVWAWRRKRIDKIRDLVNRMMVVFPFEEALYRDAGVPVTYVGHPLIDEAHSPLTRAEAASEFGLDANRPVIGLFPGSRRNEIKRLLPTMLQAAVMLHNENAARQFILPKAGTLDQSEIDLYLDPMSGVQVRVVEDRFYDVIRSCDAIVTASGTATLEIALMETPLVVVYKVSPLSFRIMRKLIKLKHIAMCNIIAGKEVAKELLQSEVTPINVANELRHMLQPSINQQRRQELKRVREILGEPGGAGRAAETALALLPSE